MLNNSKSLQFLDGFVLKIIAMITMTLDHVGIFLLHQNPDNMVGTVFRIIGRLAFPLYIFFLAEGMRNTRNKEKYLLRIGLMWGGITLGETVFVYLMNMGYTADTLSPEPFTDLFFCMLFLYLLLLPKWKKVFAILPLAIMALSFGVDAYEIMSATTIHWFPYYLRFGYGLFGALLVVLFYFAPSIAKKIHSRRIQNLGISMDEFVESAEYRRQTNLVSIAGLIISVIIFWAIGYIGRGINTAPFDVYHMGMGSYAILAGLLIYLYSGRRGYDSKAFRIISYLYFPVHLVILFFIFSF